MKSLIVAMKCGLRVRWSTSANSVTRRNRLVLLGISLISIVCFFLARLLECVREREDATLKGVTQVSGVSNIGSVRKAYKYKLQPTSEQVRQLEETLWRCRTLY